MGRDQEEFLARNPVRHAPTRMPTLADGGPAGRLHVIDRNSQRASMPRMNGLCSVNGGLSPQLGTAWQRSERLLREKWSPTRQSRVNAGLRIWGRKSAFFAGCSIREAGVGGATMERLWQLT